MVNRLAIANGRDPLTEKRRSATPTFREAAEATFESNPATLARRQDRAQLDAGHAEARVPRDRQHARRPDPPRDVLRILKPVWSVHPDVARKLRQRIRATLRWCQAHGYVEQNVAGEAIDGALPPMPAIRTHHRALAYTEIRACLETVRACRASPSARLCLEFLVLAATRSGEARSARWDEVDLRAREWRIAADRMKTNTPHVVPLSAAGGFFSTLPITEPGFEPSSWF